MQVHVSYCYGRINYNDIAFLNEQLSCLVAQRLHLSFRYGLTGFQLFNRPLTWLACMCANQSRYTYLSRSLMLHACLCDEAVIARRR